MNKTFTLRVRANPSSSCRGMTWRGDHLKVNLTAPPKDGQANEELVNYLAEFLSLRPGDIEFIRGERSRRKQLRLHNVDRGHLVRQLQTRKD